MVLKCFKRFLYAFMLLMCLFRVALIMILGCSLSILVPSSLRSLLQVKRQNFQYLHSLKYFGQFSIYLLWQHMIIPKLHTSVFELNLKSQCSLKM